MHILIGLVLALAVVGSWAAGNWFGRIGVFVCGAPLLAFIGLRYIAYQPWDTVTTEVVTMAAGTAAAWIIAAAPMYLAARKIRVHQIVPQQDGTWHYAGDTRWARKWIRSKDRS
jgi:hypothetical protein